MVTDSLAAGERSRNWLKINRVHNLVLVVLAAEWGHGRRHGWLGNLHLGARDLSEGSFVTLGKPFKGLTDALLMEQTELLQRLETARDRHTVYVRGGGGGLQREPAVSRGSDAAIRPRETVPARQARGTGGHP